MTLDFAALDKLEATGNPVSDNTPAQNVGLMYLGRKKKAGEIASFDRSDLLIFEKWLEAKDPNAKALFLANHNLAKFYKPGKI